MSASAPTESASDRLAALQQQLRQLLSDQSQPRLVNERIESALAWREVKRSEYDHANYKLQALFKYQETLPELIDKCRADIESAQHAAAVQAVAPKANRFLEMARELGISSPEQFQEFLVKVQAAEKTP